MIIAKDMDLTNNEVNIFFNNNCRICKHKVETNVEQGYVECLSSGRREFVKFWKKAQGDDAKVWHCAALCGFPDDHPISMEKKRFEKARNQKKQTLPEINSIPEIRGDLEL